MVAAVSLAVSKNTSPSPRKARITVAIGIVTSTAPKVPPSTIMAAVNCARSWMLPFSRSSPPIIPPIASAIPEMVAMSGRRPPVFAGFAGFAGFLAALSGAANGVGFTSGVGFAAPVVAMGSIVGRFAIAGRRRVIDDPRRVVVEHAPPELHDALHYFIGALAYAENLAGSQRDYGVRRHVDVLDQI